MELRAQLRQLECQYLVAASAERAARALYGVRSTTSGMRTLWRITLLHKRAIAALLRDLEDTDSVG